MMPSWPQLLILILVVVLLFGTKKLRSLGSDLGAAIKGFKNAMSHDTDNQQSGLGSVESKHSTKKTKKE